MSLSESQIALRKNRVGASEMGAIVDLYSPRGDGERIDPHRTAFDVFAERDCPPPQTEDHRQWGLDMEEPILVNWTRRQGGTLVRPGVTFTHPKIDAVCASPDGFLIRGSRVRNLQAKNAQWHQANRWGDVGSDQAPLLYVTQVSMELGILRAQEVLPGELEQEADVLVSIGGAPPVAFPIRYDEELFGRLADLASKFKRDHLDTGRPPDINASTVDSAAEWIKRKYPAQRLKLLEPTPEDRALVQLVATLRATGKAAEEEKKLAEVQLKARLGDAEGFEGLCTFKKNKDSVGPDWEKIALAIDAQKATQLARAPEYLTVTREGARVLRLSNGKEK
jgi:predicted phage-related endonuclease